MEILGLIGLIAIAFGFPCIMIIFSYMMNRNDQHRYMDDHIRYNEIESNKKAQVTKIQK